MNKVKAVLLGIAFILPLMIGCAPGAAARGVEVVSVKLQDWTDPKDGKVYVVALPTWKNNGSEAVRQVIFNATIKGKDTQPANDIKEPQFFGAIIEPGTTVEPKRIPEDGVVLGEKEAMKDVTADSVEMTAIASDQEFVPPKKSDA